MTLSKKFAEFETLWADREKRDKAKEAAVAYVEENSSELEAEFGAFGIEEMVKFIDLARVKGDEEGRIRADMWLLAKFEPQRIVGNALPGQGRR